MSYLIIQSMLRLENKTYVIKYIQIQLSLVQKVTKVIKDDY